MDGQSQIDVSQLSISDRKELNQFLNNEVQKSKINESKINRSHHLFQMERWKDMITSLSLYVLADSCWSEDSVPFLKTGSFQTNHPI